MRPFAGRPHAHPGVVRAKEVDQVPAGLARQHTREAGHRDSPIQRLEAVRNVPEQLAVTVRPEMFGGQIGRLQRERIGGRAIAASLHAVADSAVCREQLCSVHDRGRGEFGGRGEEAGGIGRDEQQIEMRNSQRDNDRAHRQCRPTHSPRDHAGDREQHGRADGDQRGDHFATKIRLIEDQGARPPREGPDRLLMRAGRVRREKACGEHHKRAQHRLGGDRCAHVAPRGVWRGSGEPIGERQPIERGQCQQHNKQPEFHQRDLAVAGAEQPRQATHEFRHL